MSRPLQQKLIESLDRIDGSLQGEDVRLPLKVAADIANELKSAMGTARDIAEFITLANSAMEALDGLVSSWPDTSLAGRFKPLNKQVLMKDKAIDQACAVLARYSEIEGDFTW